MNHRIGIITYGLDRPLAGIGRYTLELIQAFNDLNSSDDMVLLCAGGLGPLKDKVALPWVSLPGCRLLPGLLTWGNVVIRQAVKRYNLQLIHTLSSMPPFLLLDPHIRKVVTTHDVFALSIPGYSSQLDTIMYRYWLPRVLPDMDAIITVSGQSQQDILKYLHPPRERVHIIPYGVRHIFQPFSAAEARAHVTQRLHITRPYMLYVGALTRRKNIETALKAFAQVCAAFPDMLFVLAGPQSWQATPIASLVQQLGIAEHIHLTGPLTDDDLPALYNGADLFVFPSLYEGFGLPVLEAMACGTPVITSNVSSLPEVAGNAALLVDPYNVDELAGAIRRILSDPALAADLRAKGLERARQFSWERTAQETLEVYRNILQQTH
jgi:glycosyltransferase involved in cell wall biosynthesis